MSQLSQKYAADVAIYFDKHIIPQLGGDAPIKKIGAREITAFGTALVNESGLMPQTANKVLSTLSKALKYAASCGWIDAVPYIQRMPEQR